MRTNPYPQHDKKDNRDKQKIKIYHDHPTYLYCCSCGTGGAKADGHKQIAVNINSISNKE